MLRGACILLAAFLGIGALMTVVTLRSHAPAAEQWAVFSIQPATGSNTTINPGRLQSDGMTLLSALSVAYAIPQVRIIGPPWLGWQRFSITAVLNPDAGGFFPTLFQRELSKYLDLQVHQEPHEFSVLILRAGKPVLEKAAGHEPLTYVHPSDCEARQVTLDGLAGVLQNILARPVVNETGIEGRYNFKFEWGADRGATVPEVMRNRFGLELTEGRRVLDALIVDRAVRGPALMIVGKVSRFSEPLPAGLRNRLARIIALH